MGAFDKKVDRALGRLTERRGKAGVEHKAETGKDRQNRLTRQLEVAAKSGNLNALISLMAETNKTPVAERVKVLLGSITFIYYTYVDSFHVRPKDMDDLADGLLFLDSKALIQADATERAQAKARAAHDAGRNGKSGSPPPNRGGGFLR